MAESDLASDAGDARDERINLRAQTVRALARGGMSGVQVLSWATADEVLTPKRRELIETLRTTETDSVRALARELRRDKGQVSRDLGALAEHGIVRYETDGNAKRPRLTQEHTIIEPIV